MQILYYGPHFRTLNFCLKPISYWLNSAWVLGLTGSLLVDWLIFIASGLTIILQQILTKQYLKQ